MFYFEKWQCRVSCTATFRFKEKNYDGIIVYCFFKITVYLYFFGRLSPHHEFVGKYRLDAYSHSLNSDTPFMIHIVSFYYLT